MEAVKGVDVIEITASGAMADCGLGAGNVEGESGTCVPVSRKMLE